MSPKSPQYRRLYRDLLARLIVRLYRDIITKLLTFDDFFLNFFKELVINPKRQAFVGMSRCHWIDRQQTCLNSLLPFGFW